MARPQAHVTVPGELALFLRPSRRLQPVPGICDGVSTLGHVVESIGVPLTEVGLLLVNDRPADRSYRPRDEDTVEVVPMSRPQPLDDARFLLDVHLGTVARRLRLLGIDTAYHRYADDDDLIDEANADRRVLLTQDRGLLRRRKLWLGAYVRGASTDTQLADVLDRFAPALAPWTRCTSCNGLLAPAPKADIEPQLKPGTRRTYDAFARCQSCGRLYWRGAHSKRLEATVDAAARVVSEAGRHGPPGTALSAGAALSAGQSGPASGGTQSSWAPPAPLKSGEGGPRLF